MVPVVKVCLHVRTLAAREAATLITAEGNLCQVGTKKEGKRMALRKRAHGDCHTSFRFDVNLLVD